MMLSDKLSSIIIYRNAIYKISKALKNLFLKNLMQRDIISAKTFSRQKILKFMHLRVKICQEVNLKARVSTVIVVQMITP